MASYQANVENSFLDPNSDAWIYTDTAPSGFAYLIIINKDLKKMRAVAVRVVVGCFGIMLHCK